MRKLIVLLYLIFLVQAIKTNKPWTKKVFTENKTNNFYIKVSNKHLSLKKTMNKAYFNAISELLKHNFPLKSSYHQSTLSNLNKLDVQESINIKTSSVILNNIKPFKEKIIVKEDYYTVYHQIKISKKAIKIEKQRLKSKIPSLNNFDNKKSLKKITIKTNPKHTKIRINTINQNFSISKTSNNDFHLPLRNYNISLFKEKFEHLKFKIVISGKHLTITKKLVKTYEYINLSTSPEDSIVKLNDVILNKKGLIKLITGKSNKLSIKHVDYERIEEDVTVYHKETISIFRRLRPKASYVSIDSIPSKTMVFINNIHIGYTPLENHQIIEDEYQVLLRKEGFRDLHYELPIKANRNLSPEVHTLKKKKINKYHNRYLSSISHSNSNYYNSQTY